MSAYISYEERIIQYRCRRVYVLDIKNISLISTIIALEKEIKRVKRDSYIFDNLSSFSQL